MNRLIFAIACAVLIFGLFSAPAAAKTLKKTLEKKFYDVGNTVEALDFIEDYIKNNPNDFEGYYEKAKWQIKTLNVGEETAALINRALELAPDKSLVEDDLRLDAFIILGMKDEARQLIQKMKAAKKSPESFEAIYNILVDYVAQDYQQAYDEAVKAADTLEANEARMLIMYHSQLCMGNVTGELIMELSNFGNQYSETALVWDVVADYYFDRGEYDKTISALSMMFNRPVSVYARPYNQCDYKTRASKKTAFTRYLQGDMDNAKLAISEALKFGCSSGEYNYVESMNDYFNTRTDKVINKYFERELYRKSKDPFKYWIKSIVREKEGVLSEAERLYFAAVENKPFNTLEAKNDNGLITDEDYDKLRNIALRVEKNMARYKTTECSTPFPNIPNGMFFVKSGRYLYDEIIRYYDGEDDGCEYVIYKSKSGEPLTDEKIKEYYPFVDDMNKSTKKEYFYTRGFIPTWELGAPLCY